MVEVQFVNFGLHNGHVIPDAGKGVQTCDLFGQYEWVDPKWQLSPADFGELSRVVLSVVDRREDTAAR